MGRGVTSQWSTAALLPVTHAFRHRSGHVSRPHARPPGRSYFTRRAEPSPPHGRSRSLPASTPQGHPPPCPSPDGPGCPQARGAPSMRQPKGPGIRNTKKFRSSGLDPGPTRNQSTAQRPRVDPGSSPGTREVQVWLDPISTHTAIVRFNRTIQRHRQRPPRWENSADSLGSPGQAVGWREGKRETLPNNVIPDLIWDPGRISQPHPNYSGPRIKSGVTIGWK